MYPNPNIHIELARARQADLLREARHDELARSVEQARPGLIARLRGRFGERNAKQPAARPAWQRG
jgi:hypothetical protein